MFRTFEVPVAFEILVYCRRESIKRAYLRELLGSSGAKECSKGASVEVESIDPLDVAPSGLLDN